MNILLVPSAYFPSVGGVQLNTHALAKSLLARGHHVTILTSKWRRWTLPFHETLDGVSVHRLPFSLYRGSLKSLIGFCFILPITVAATWMRIRQVRPDVINIHFAGTNALYVLIALLGSRIPLVLTFHGGEVINVGDPALVGYTKMEERLMIRVITAALSRADAVTAVSQYLLDSAAHLRPDLPSCSRRIFMGGYRGDRATDAQEEKAVPELATGRFVLAVGRLVREKGLDLLVEAFSRLAQEDADLNLVIVGDGPERNRLQDQAIAAGLAERIRFTGNLLRQDIGVFYRNCLALALPSRWQEAFPGVVLEAFLHEKPVVAAAVGGVPEMVVNEFTGLLVPPEDSEQLAAAILRLIASPELRSTCGRNGGEFARVNVDWHNIGKDYEDVYKHVSAEKDTRSAVVQSI